ncbi:DUF7373 family lipoprotein [Nocardia huaxiensis]|uniref:DUF7373 family lipoprotein n=1 Tax=Nocardia huaxiensis TaxID=2755382 RepID=UPI001E5F342D|nr:hypothetical protein [Nocardia huaxiensis]UFS95445.1 hypothetical protein LPY97_32985 [Nocardia huaxiensis]
MRGWAGVRFAAAVVAVVMAAGCGNGAVGVEYGPYSTQRIAGDYDAPSSSARGVLAESLRLGEHLAYPGEVDSTLRVGRGGGVIVDIDGVNDMLSGAQQRALSGFDINGGFGAIAADREYHANQAERMLSMVLLAFPDEQTANSAAAAMARADFDQAAAENASLSIPGYPAALAHWRPGVPTIGSWLVVKSVVIRVFAQLTEANPDLLTAAVANAYQRQAPALDGFAPTTRDQLPKLALDPNGELTRLVGTADPTPNNMTFAVYSTHAFAVLVPDPIGSLAAFTKQGVSTIAVADNKFLYRAKNAEAARALMTYLMETPSTISYTPISGVAGIEGIRCGQATQPNPTEMKPYRFRCFVTRGASVARVASNQDTDVRWLAAAQYAVMGDE